MAFQPGYQKVTQMSSIQWTDGYNGNDQSMSDQFGIELVATKDRVAFEPYFLGNDAHNSPRAENQNIIWRSVNGTCDVSIYVGKVKLVEYSVGGYTLHFEKNSSKKTNKNFFKANSRCHTRDKRVEFILALDATDDPSSGNIEVPVLYNSVANKYNPVVGDDIYVDVHSSSYFLKSIGTSGFDYYESPEAEGGWLTPENPRGLRFGMAAYETGLMIYPKSGHPNWQAVFMCDGQPSATLGGSARYRIDIYGTASPTANVTSTIRSIENGNDSGDFAIETIQDIVNDGSSIGWTTNILAEREYYDRLLQNGQWEDASIQLENAVAVTDLTAPHGVFTNNLEKVIRPIAGGEAYRAQLNYTIRDSYGNNIEKQFVLKGDVLENPTNQVIEVTNFSSLSSGTNTDLGDFTYDLPHRGVLSVQLKIGHLSNSQIDELKKGRVLTITNFISDGGFLRVERTQVTFDIIDINPYNQYILTQPFLMLIRRHNRPGTQLSGYAGYQIGLLNRTFNFDIVCRMPFEYGMEVFTPGGGSRLTAGGRQFKVVARTTGQMQSPLHTVSIPELVNDGTFVVTNSKKNSYVVATLNYSQKRLEITLNSNLGGFYSSGTFPGHTGSLGGSQYDITVYRI